MPAAVGCNMKMVAFGFAVVFSIICQQCAVAKNINYLHETFRVQSNNGVINHFTLDANTSKVYIGAVNRLYQLTEHLHPEKTVTTGPRDDSSYCPPEPTVPCECSNTNCEEHMKRPTNSVNKALLIDNVSQKLLVCTNLYQGHCERRELKDISKKCQDIWKPLVPNDAVSSVVMFIAPGPMDKKVLYIAATRSTEGTMKVYKDLIPAISSRLLNNFSIAYQDVSTATKKDIETQQKETFRVSYVYGFSSDGFSYFLSVQKDTIDSMNYVTRIIRVCQKDSHYYSYTEIPLECHVNGTNYNILVAAYVSKSGRDLARSLDLADEPPFTDSEHVLFAVFAKSQPNTDKVTNDSALCVYSMREIRSKFTSNIQTCFKGIGNTGPAHIVKEIGCVDVYKQYPIRDNFCNLANDSPVDINTPIAGLDPVQKVAAFHYKGTLMTSIIVAIVHDDYTVAFVGSSRGHLQKIVVNTGTNATEYEQAVVEEGNRVNRDMAFDHTGSFVYVVTLRKVTRVKVEECGQYETCSKCLGSRDPYCGWCTFEKRCTIKRTCTGDTTALSWLSYGKAQCTKIVSVIPQQVQVQKDRAKMLTLTIQNLPLPQRHEYECAFSGYGISRTTTAMLLSNEEAGKSVNHTVQCETPNSNLLPVIPTGQDHVMMRLSVRMNGKDFVSDNLTFFDCSLHSSCTSCTNSDYPCTWCIRTHHERQCVFDRESCNNDVLITGKSVEGATDRPGPKYCPRIESSFTKILVPSGTKKQVTVRAIHLEDFQTDFKCVFMDGHKEVGAVKIGTQITCEPFLFKYTSATPYRNVPFQVIWGPQKKRLDNPDNIQVKVYQCSAMASNCGECLTAESEFECGWCDDRCTIEDHCIATRWLSNSAICPNPKILRFYPMTGPREGGTNVTIDGENLGKIFDDIKHNVKVAGVNCQPYEDLYVKSKRIVCLTGKRLRRQSKSGNVEVVVNNRYTCRSSQMFSYVSPNIRGFQPTVGPQSGGTRLTIRGTSLNAGTRITATVVGMPCHIVRTSRSTAVCITSVNSISDAVGLVEMSFDRAHISYNGEPKFQYVHDPIIEAVREEKGIVSGGTKVIVNGENLDVIQEPHMVVYVNNKPYISDCDVVTSTKMSCQTPEINKESGIISSAIQPTNPMILHYGFIMDNVTELRNLSAGYKYDGTHRFLLYPNPQFDQWTKAKNFQLTSEYLTINGQNLNLVLTKDDIRVQIGDSSCIVSSISPTQLTCQPPVPEVEGVGTDPSVVVYIGRNFSCVIGQLKYEGPQTHFPLPVIIGIIVAASFLILVIVVICIAYHRKSQESGRVMKRMQNQMDKLEASVAKECKEAFAELQTDITELTNDLSGPAGIPFRSYQAFCMKVLFPNVPTDEHPVTRELIVEASTLEGLRRFNQLIGNKTFLLLFIRTLERNPNFSMRERVNIASLLSVALQNRMEYHTDILKTLLAELIEKSMEGRSFHPKLFLRRTESVAEKMLTNWFTFLLYRFLQECAGEPLFVLFRAIKQQVDKGPVDTVTSEAKYSLSEDKLIRQMVEYSPMTIHVLEPDYQYGNEYVVKVLDCDTISQVREKILDTIYRNIPYSTWPNRDLLDLQWRNGKRGRVILQDEDMTTKVEGDYKRYNTLAHYKVSDGALMALMPKQASQQSLSLSSGSHHKFTDGFYSGSPSFSRSLTPAGIQMDIDSGGSKFYHLVKHPDSELHSEGDRSNKMVSEIYLTRLLATKGTLQQYVDDLFETIFSTANRISVMPLAIKYMFDFLDDQALHHGITDPEVVHTWKSNSLPLRFWVNVVKNPDFVFDVCKSNIVDSCLSVVAQTFMDSCSMSEHRLGKDSPSSKLLYAKDIPKYKKWVERYYQDIKLMPAISDQDMNVTLAEETKLHENEFNLNAALHELYRYAVYYNDELMQTLEEDEFARNYQLAHRLDQVHELMESDA